MIGSQIRKFRHNRGLSLSEFARLTGMSKSMVSQVERGLCNPSVEKIRSIAATLQVPVFTLFLNNKDSQGMLVRKDKRMTLNVPDSKIVRELLTPDLHRGIALVVARVPPCERSSPTFTTHLGEECIFVLRGRIMIHLHEETHLLETGDAIYFDGRQPHYCSNPDEIEAEFLSAMVPDMPPVSRRTRR
jgi:transcriptional regulator with XRE-family HTH domain